MENYSSRFSALLHLEELQREEDIRQFEMFSVSHMTSYVMYVECASTVAWSTAVGEYALPWAVSKPGCSRSCREEALTVGGG